MLKLLPYVSLGVSLLAVVVSYYCFRLTQQRAVRPVLVFSPEGKDDKGISVWRVENAGPGPAINVSLAAGSSDRAWDPQTALLLPALSSGAKFRLTWIQRPLCLFGIYSDSEGRTYTTTCTRNRNRIERGNQFPALQPSRFAYQLRREQETM